METLHYTTPPTSEHQWKYAKIHLQLPERQIDPYAGCPKKVAELKVAIERECTKILNEVFHDVCDSIASCCQ